MTLAGCGDRQRDSPPGDGTPPPPTGACAVQELRYLRDTGHGLDWSYTRNQLVLASRDGSSIMQIYTMRPDGSELNCLTCTEVVGGPRLGVHKGVPHWHPSGNYIFLQVERENHGGNRFFAEPGQGRWNEIWATTPTGDRWWRLTDYSANQESGVLFPVPSRDGRRLVWAERIAGPKNPVAVLLSLAAMRPVKEIWGYWQMNMADIVIDSFGNVNLTGIRSFTPGGSASNTPANPNAGATFYEMQDWMRDDSGLYFAADIDRPHPQVLDIFRLDLRTEQVTPITATSDHWEEHISISPSGRRTVLMSSECCTWNPGDVRTLVAELYLADANGGNKTKLTNFNTPGAPEYSGVKIATTKGIWSPDGRQIYFNRQVVLGEDVAQRKPELWVLTFAGACGAS